MGFCDVPWFSKLVWAEGPSTTQLTTHRHGYGLEVVGSSRFSALECAYAGRTWKSRNTVQNLEHDQKPYTMIKRL